MSVVKKATRESYGEALVEIGADPRVMVLDADLSKSTKTDNFKKKYPERFYNMGIAEANMMCVAAGMATCGKVVFASSFAIFASGRAYEQVRNSICYPELNVKIGATHAGITVGEDGASHQCNEDFSLMRVLPNMVVLSPSDHVSAKKAVKAAFNHYGPVYLRFGRAAVPVLYDENLDFQIGKGIKIKDGSDVSLIANGIMVSAALEASEMLQAEGISARVIDIYSIKPSDEKIIITAAKETGAIVTCEEHNIIGGLGSAVAEVVAEKCPVYLNRVGIKDKFGKSGKPNELLEMYGLTPKDIVKSAKDVLKKKGSK
jgi:transketolase